jgi:hypothetical protein
MADHIRRMLKKGGSAARAKGVQWFFKEEIKSPAAGAPPIFAVPLFDAADKFTLTLDWLSCCR